MIAQLPIRSSWKSFFFKQSYFAEDVCQDAKDFYARGWLFGTSGNFSIRGHEANGCNENTYWVTASGLDKGNLSVEDFIHLGAGLTYVNPNEARKPSDESLVHEAIYQHIETAHVVYHVHPPYGTWLSRYQAPQVTLINLPAIEMIKGLGLPTHEVEVGLPVLPNTQSMQDLCTVLDPLWDALMIPAFFIQGHGLYAWGATPQEAKRHVEILEFLFQQQVWDKLYEGRLASAD
jgi:methylthioribulose-1-phosphate dehydratase